MLDVAVIADPVIAGACLDPLRAGLLRALIQPGSATSLAATAGLSRQQVNYHLRALEQHGLVELVQERRKGNCIERLLQATAASYVISPNALSGLAPDPDRAPDTFSARWLLSLAARLVRDLGDLMTGATAAKQPLATFALDSELTFATAADRAAFAAELAGAVSDLVARHHCEAVGRGRRHRLIIALHPSVKRPDVQPLASAPAKESADE